MVITRLLHSHGGSLYPLYVIIEASNSLREGQCQDLQDRRARVEERNLSFSPNYPGCSCLPALPGSEEMGFEPCRTSHTLHTELFSFF